MVKNEELMKVLGKIKYKYNETQSQVAKKLGTSRQYLTDVVNGRYPYNEKLKDRIQECYPDIFESADNEKPVVSFSDGKPYYSVDFEMGYDELINDQTNHPDFLIDFKPYNKCDLWCNARGDSMNPTISSGDIIALKEIKDTRYIISNEIYAIVTTNGLRTIKRIVDKGDRYTLVPDNKSYPEQDIDKSIILRLFLVIGAMKMF